MAADASITTLDVLRVEFERRWLDGPLQRRVAVALFVVGTLGIAVASVALRDRLGVESRAEAALSAERAAMPAGSGRPMVVTGSDFTRTLPPRPDVDRALDALHRAAADAGLTMGSLQIHARPGSVVQLGRSEIVVALQGRYPNALKAAGEVLERLPWVTVRRLTMVRTDESAELDLTVAFSVWSAPASATQPGPAESSRERSTR